MKNKIRPIIMVSFITMTIFGANALTAKTAKIAFMAGKVEVKTAASANYSAAKLNQNLSAGDSIKTLANSFVILGFTDGSKVKMRADSELVLSNMGGLDGLKSDVQLNLLKGAVFSQVTKRQQGEIFQVKAMTHVAGVRGTQFLVAIDKINSADDSVMMCVNEGSIEVKAAFGNEKTLVNQGEGVVINPREKSGEIPAPQKLAWIKSFNWNMDPQSGKIEDTTNLEKAYKGDYKSKDKKNDGKSKYKNIKDQDYD